MALRPYITAGVAFAAAGAVAATVAIAPPMSPGDVKVAKNTEVALNAVITDPNLVPLINAYFSEPPDGIRTGATGVAQQLLLAANSNDAVGQALINVYFQGGATSLTQLFLTAFNADPSARQQINTFFDGGLSELARLRLLWSTNDPTQRAWINRYFGEFVNDDGSDNRAQNGAPGVFWKVLADRGLGVDQRRLLDTFFNAPTEYNSQAVPIETGNIIQVPVLDENGQPTFEPVIDDDGNPVLNPDGTPLLQQVFEDLLDEDGNPVAETVLVGNSNPARRGSFGVLYNQIKGTGLSPDQQVTLDEFWDGGATEVVRNRLINSTADPSQKQTIATYFDGGIDEVIRERLLASGDANSRNLTNEFFDNGITGVVRYLLVGPVPEPEPEEPEEPNPDDPPTEEPEGFAAKAEEGSAEEDAEVTTTEADAKKPEAATDPVTTLVAKATDAMAAAVAPEAEPEAAPAPKAESTSKVKDKEAAPEEEGATNVKSGNKVEPVIILPGGSAGSGQRGGGAWGWKGVADRVNGFVKGVQKATGGGGDSASSDSGDSGGSDSDGGGDGGGE